MNGKAKVADTTMAINKLNLIIAQQEREKQAYADEMAKQKAELLKVQQLERDLLLAKSKADKGKEASDDIPPEMAEEIRINLEAQ